MHPLSRIVNFYPLSRIVNFYPLSRIVNFQTRLVVRVASTYGNRFDLLLLHYSQA